MTMITTFITPTTNLRNLQTVRCIEESSSPTRVSFHPILVAFGRPARVVSADLQSNTVRLCLDTENRMLLGRVDKWLCRAYPYALLDTSGRMSWCDKKSHEVRSTIQNVDVMHVDHSLSLHKPNAAAGGLRRWFRAGQRVLFSAVANTMLYSVTTHQWKIEWSIHNIVVVPDDFELIVHKPCTESEDQCKICYNEPLSHVCLPCRHFCLGSACTWKLWTDDNDSAYDEHVAAQCPVCRTTIQTFFAWFMLPAHMNVFVP